MHNRLLDAESFEPISVNDLRRITVASLRSIREPLVVTNVNANPHSFENRKLAVLIPYKQYLEFQDTVIQSLLFAESLHVDTVG